MISFFFFFNDTATTEIYTLSLHDALPIYIWYTLSQHSGSDLLEGLKVPEGGLDTGVVDDEVELGPVGRRLGNVRDRKSTRLNSSHLVISYAVFCLKKKKQMIA